MLEWVWQNGFGETGTRDGFSEMFVSDANVEKTLAAIEFLTQRYADNPAFVAISLLNEPIVAHTPYEPLVKVRCDNWEDKSGRYCRQPP